MCLARGYEQGAIQPERSNKLKLCSGQRRHGKKGVQRFQRKEYVNCLKVITLKTNKRRVIIVAKNSKNKGSKNTGINTKSVLRPGHGGRQRLSRRKG